jgi:hypothetical protein
VRMISVKRNVRYHKHAVSYLFPGEGRPPRQWPSGALLLISHY